MGALETVKKGLRRSPLMPLLRHRKFHAYCLGLPKTGTTSIALMFRDRYRAAHEPLPPSTRAWVLDRCRGVQRGRDMDRFLRRRDRDLYLEMESSHPVAVFVDRLVELFPRSRFILTIREPRAWLGSLIGEQLRSRERWQRMPEPGWRSRFFPALHDICCGGHDFAAGERALQERGLYPLDGYLGWWKAHNERVLAAVPPERLLVQRTDGISAAADSIAGFLGVGAETLDGRRRHANRAPRSSDVLDLVDPSFLEDRIAHHCLDLWHRMTQLTRSPAEGSHPEATY